MLGTFTLPPLLAASHDIPANASHNSTHAYIVFGVLVLTLIGFLWGRFRYDFVALAGLFILVLAGIINAESAFVGFGNSAVITVAAVMVISKGLQNAGVVDVLASLMSRLGKSITLQVTALTAIVTIASGFMNNLGALALLMPVAIRLATKAGYAPSVVLLPLAFGSLIGGSLTMIGSPLNLIITAYRAGADVVLPDGTHFFGGEAYSMFDYMPAGLAASVAGILFMGLIGWRMVPKRTSSEGKGLFNIGAYLTEARVQPDSDHIGRSIADIRAIGESGAVVVSIVRDERRISAPSPYFALQANDILLLEGEAEAIRQAIAGTKFQLVGSKDLGEKEMSSADIMVTEAIVTPSSFMAGRNAAGLNLRRYHGVNLLAVARHGQRVQARLGMIRFQVGDVLLIQAQRNTLPETMATLGLLPLAERGIAAPRPRKLIMALGVFAIALAVAATGVLPTAVTLTMAAGAMHLMGFLPLHEAYRSIDLPIIVLLAAMLPVGAALDSTGGAQMLADLMMVLSGDLPVWATCAILFAASSAISNVVNNAAAGLLMAPIAVAVAMGLHINPDALVMIVVMGSTAAFLTPVAHQSNMLVLGPGGFRFGDYWKLGLPLTIVTGIVSIPTVLWWWG